MTLNNSELGRKISEYSGYSFDSRYFFQRVSVFIRPKMKWARSHSSLVLVFFLLFNPGDLYYLEQLSFFLFQRLSVLIERFNAVLLHDCFVDEVAGHSS